MTAHAAPSLPVTVRAPSPPTRAGTLGFALVGSLWLFAFAPQAQVLAIAPGVVGMLAIIERCRRTRGVVGAVLLFGTVAIGIGYFWLADTVRAFGELDTRVGALAAPVSWLLLVVYAMWSTIHIVLFAILHRAMLRGGRRPHPLATAAVFVACEILPIRFLAWAAGYGAVESAPLRQLAAWGGVPLVSFALMCFAVPLHEGLVWVFARPDRPAARPRAAAATLFVGIMLFGWGWASLATETHGHSEAPTTLRVALVQANVGSTAKRDAEAGRRARESIAAYERGTRAAVAAGAELIVWPETALVEGARLVDEKGAPLPRERIDAHLARLGYGFLADVGHERTLLLGGYEDQERGGPASRVRFNVAMLREPAGASWSVYRKVKLMPFGEAIPGQDTFSSLRDLLPQSIPMSAGTPDQPPLAWKARGLSICAFVCYEAIVPTLVARLAGATRPDLLVNLTNDSWYGDTWEPHQHLAFSRFRAVEHRTPMLRATNTGISAVVSPTGEVLARLGYGKEGLVTADVELRSRAQTVYARTASHQPWGWWVLALGLVIVAPRRR